MKTMPMIFCAALSLSWIAERAYGFNPQPEPPGYQGRLVDQGTPANGLYDIQFTLFDTNSGGVPVRVSTNANVAVSNGLFMTSLSGLTPIAPEFLGGGYLELSVRRSGGAGQTFTTLSPRQAFTPAAGAHVAAIAVVAQSLESSSNLPVSLKINGQQSLSLSGIDVSPTRPPNLIVGYSGNQVLMNAIGSVIGGGGSTGAINRVTADFATLNGGLGNQAGAGTPPVLGIPLPGGNCPSPSGVGSTIGGGGGNWAGGDYATVSGGKANMASGSWSSIGGGQTNFAAACWTTIGGGLNNSVKTSSPYATISGGNYNLIETNTPNATISGGQENRISIDSPYATVAGGRAGLADHYGQFAYAHGSFGGVAGSAQTSIMVPHGISTNTNVVELFLDGPAGSRRMVVSPGATWVFDILVTGRTSAGQSAGYTVRGVIENVGGAMAFVGVPTVTALGEDVGLWNVSVLADNANDALVIRASGSTGAVVRWVASVRTAEVIN